MIAFVPLSGKKYPILGALAHGLYPLRLLRAEASEEKIYGTTDPYGNFFVSYIFLLYVFRLLCLRFFNCRKDQSFRIFFYFKCFTDPGLLKIRQLSTPCRCGLSSL